ncbi:MAG: HD domain-containing protein [Candidatus Staskawiczbacteria bacterium]|nr:HD domain-containing protein [Candidatus Staskawiczbacteria bacterium]
MTTTLKDVQKDPQILEFIKQTEFAMSALAYTNHGLRHANIVADRAIKIAKDIGLPQREGELAAIAGFCHDMGNFLSRHLHNYLAATLFHQVFNGKFEPEEMAKIIQAISNHDKDEMNLTSAISAVVILADKSDVSRSRVVAETMKDIKSDIHDRVNYATTESGLKVDKAKKSITLKLKIDTNFCPIMEYFEIFTERMVFCRKAAEFLGYKFGIVINKTRLL